MFAARKRGYPVWWTRERVLAGLRRLHRELGQLPTSSPVYQELTRGGGMYGPTRPYPSVPSILRYFPSLVDAWVAADVVCGPPRPTRPRGPRLELVKSPGGGANHRPVPAVGSIARRLDDVIAELRALREPLEQLEAEAARYEAARHLLRRNDGRR